MRLALFSFLFCCLALAAPLAQDHASTVHDALLKGLFQGDRAMNDIATLISFGPRSPDSAGHELALQYIEQEMHKAGAASVSAQQWVDEPDKTLLERLSGSGVRRRTMANIIVRFAPDNPRRVIVGTHYDSIIRAYADKVNPLAIMPGANNSASGVALLLETARALQQLPAPSVGIDFVFFDGEEGPLSLGAGDPSWRALGSPYFAEHIAEVYPKKKPEEAVLFDMVCYKKMQLKKEPLSLKGAEARVTQFWDIGSTYSSTIFKDEIYGYPIDDDQNALNGIGIPSFLVIGFEYDPYFNTTEDTIDKCSSANLTTLGDTLISYIYSL